MTGRLVPIRAAAALREALAAYLDDPHLRAMHGKASRQRAVECFSLERMCQDYTDLYRRLLPAGSPQEH